MISLFSLVTFLILAAFVKAGDRVVFVHGLAGWGPGEFGPLDYWAYVKEFKNQGYTVHEASVGPVSSNWDRACELYAQIKGTKVDYGLAHSKKYGHNRYGKDYTGKGFYSTWSATNTLHLVGHSMGGQTIRMLEALLQEGDAEEKKATGSSTSALFSKQGNWIATITTISTPHDGTPLVDILGTKIVEFIKDLVVGIAGLGSATGLDALYDFDLDHWGISKSKGESFQNYWKRVAASKAFSQGNKDFATYDLSIAGSKVLQQRGKETYPGTYYFAYATDQTKWSWGCNLRLKCGWRAEPKNTMWIFLAPFAKLIGDLGTPEISRRSDGLVPVESSKCPKIGYSSSRCSEYKGSWPQSKWVWQVISRDHLQVIGFSLLYSLFTDDIYRSHAKRIAKLNAVTSQTFTEDTGGSIGSSDLAPPADPVTASSSSILSITVVGTLAFAVVGVAAGLLVRKNRNAAQIVQEKGTIQTTNPTYAYAV